MEMNKQLSLTANNPGGATTASTAAIGAIVAIDVESAIHVEAVGHLDEDTTAPTPTQGVCGTWTTPTSCQCWLIEGAIVHAT